MKKTMKLWAAVLIASAVTATGCSNIVDEPVSKDAARTITITASLEMEGDAAASALSKANWADGAGLQWDESDAEKFGLVDDKGGNNASTSLEIADDGTATFTGEVKSDAASFLATYPKAGAGVNDACSTIYFNIASAQTQTAAGAMESADGKVLLVGSAPIELSASVSDYSASMRMISSLARFLVYSKEGKSDKVKSISVTSDKDIAGSRVAIVNWSNEGNYEFNGGEVSKTATVTLGEAFDLNGITSEDATEGIYLGLIPAASTSTTYTVTTETGAYVFTPSSAVEFKAGTIHNIALNLDKGTFVSTENDVTFTPGVNADQNVNADAHTLYLGTTTATHGSEKVTMNADDCVLVVVGDEGDDLSWISAFWENTNNYNLGIKIEKNKTASARAAQVYMEYKGIRSKNCIKVHQDAGTGLPTIIPTLVLTHEDEIVYGGETVESAATLSLTVDGEQKTGSDVDAYLSNIKLSCGSAAAECKEGTVSITFPENTTASPKTYTLSVKTEDSSATLTFTQSANPDAEDGDTDSHTYSYKLYNNATDKSKSTGFGSAAGAIGDWYRFESVTIDGTSYPAGDALKNLSTSDLGQEMLNYAFSFVELESDDVQVPGTDPLTTVEEMKEFVELQIWNDGGAAIYVRIVLKQNTTGKRRTFKIQTKDGDGNVLSTIVYFQNA